MTKTAIMRDVETTGLDMARNEIIEFATVTFHVGCNLSSATLAHLAPLD
jgi:DNA polymerase III alpha subunit (gram-positive type)